MLLFVSREIPGPELGFMKLSMLAKPHNHHALFPGLKLGFMMAMLSAGIWLHMVYHLLLVFHAPG